ncbi:MAG: hypothetical protein L0219_19515, partial [Phycisphaerales bacterium]|nr:hypothetical protein [Phycisphaerales bacterium]
GGDCDLHSGAFSGACSDFSDWLENANELNIAYSLSAELAATRLSILFKNLDDNARVIVSDQVAAQLGLPGNTVKVVTVVKSANEALTLQSLAIEPSPMRDYQATLANILHDINGNNLPRIFLDAQIDY